VTFLVRARRAEEIKSKGLQILSPHGDLTLYPETLTSEKLTKPYDLILLAVKSYTLSGAMNDFAPAVGPDTMILPALNGMRHIDLLIARFGKKAVLGGVCLVATEIDPEGRIQQLSGFQSIRYGELDCHSTERLRRVDATLGGAGFDASSSNQIMQDMWGNGCSSRPWETLPASCAAISGRLPQFQEAPTFPLQRFASTPGLQAHAVTRNPTHSSTSRLFS